MLITRTPFRISFFGGGTDYPVWYKEHGGAVLSATIDKYCYITARYIPPFFDCNYRIRYVKLEETKTQKEIEHPSVRECLAHMAFSKGIEMQHNADVPGMSGLGSSSAFTVGFLNALYNLKGDEVGKRQLALDAIHVEQDRIKESVGSQDQTAAAYGGFNKIVFGGEQGISVTPVPVSRDRLLKLENNLMLFFTGYPRNASEIAKEQIKKTPERKVELAKMYSMVDQGYNILTDEKADLDEFGKLLHESWMIKRGLTSKITNDDINSMYSNARKAGALGGKLIGAGGGGFLLFYVPVEKQMAVKAVLSNLLHVPFKFENLGSQVIYNVPTDNY
ncbi:MAG: kinase [bacterium]|nr:kinase [bacterium]